jgi:CRP-like cAMP-binding protein
LFRGVSDDVLAELQAAAQLETYREGQLLWRAGDPASCFTVIARGLVQIQRSTPSGDHAIVGVFGPKESIGDGAAVERSSYPASACALSETVDVIRVPASLVLRFMQRDESLMRCVHGALVRHASALAAKIDIVSAGSVPARLAMLHLHLAERFGDEDEAHRTFVPLLLSRATMSRLVSARVETVIRALSGWQKSNLLRNVGGGFEIPDLEALRAIAREG